MSTTIIASYILFGSCLIMLIFRMPISFTLGFSSLLTAWYLDLNMLTICQKMVSGMQSFPLLAIPFFILCGEIMGQGGISEQIINLAKALVGHWHGGVAEVNVLGSMLFGGISGSPSADCASLGPLEIKLMLDSGYDRDFAVALTIASSCQATLIPPSHNMVIYALVAGAGVSIGALLMAGLLPGLVLGFAMMIYVYIIARRNNYPRGRKYSMKERVAVIRDGFFGLLTAVIIVVGVSGGICTATESSAVAVVYSFFITFFVYKKIPLKKMWPILRNVLSTLAMVLALMSTAQIFSYLLAYLRIPAMITDVLLSFSSNKIVILLLVDLMLLVLGCVMDMAPLIIICTPVLLPVVAKFGMSPIQFGVVMILNLSIGLCTPPVGSTLFIGCAIGKVSMSSATKALLPLYGVMILVLLLVTFIPQLSMWLPNLLY